MKDLNSRKLWVDVLLFVGTLGLYAHKATGDSLHEWLGAVVFALLIWHLLLNWNWIVGGGKKFFGKLPGIVRFNYVWDFLLYFLFVGATFTGILISRTFLKTFGVSIENDPFMSYLHKRLCFWLIFAFGVHLGVHYRWIFNAFRRKGTAENAVETVEKKEANQ